MLPKLITSCTVALFILSLSVQAVPFVLESVQDVETGNDSLLLPTAVNTSGNAMSMRNTASRRRVSYVRYDISSLKTLNPDITFRDIHFNLLTAQRSDISIWGVPEELDNFDLHTASYSTAPGIQWDSNTPLDSSVILNSAELSLELLHIYSSDLIVNQRVDTASSASLDEFFNNDTDGIIVLMLSGSNAIVRAVEYNSGGYGDPPLDGIVLLGETVTAEKTLRPRYMEQLNRGLTAIYKGGGSIYIGWRILGTDPQDIAFNLYRNTTKLNTSPVSQSTNWLDTGVSVTQANTYRLRAIIGGQEQTEESTFTLVANPVVPIDQPNPYGYNLAHITIPLQATTSVDRIGVGDLDGNGSYDYVVKQPAGISDPGAYKAAEDTFKLEGYSSEGTFLWSIDLGWNIEQGIWWSPMLVYDLDCDGRAEVIAKSAPTDADYRNPDGRVLSGPEWFTIWDGQTGTELAATDWIPRGNISDWGDSYGNRVNRNMMCIAYLDGVKPSLVIFRGIYGLMKAQAWNFRNGKLTRLWDWSNEGLGTAYQGMGYHQIRVGDVDGDGRDEILNGCILIDDDGKTLYTTGEGHGDRFHLTDIDPNRAGLETFYIHEGGYTHAIDLRDSRTGQLIWGQGDSSWGDVGRGLCGDIDPTQPGMECWTAKPGLWNSQGQSIDPNGPRYASSFVCDMGIWWDDDLSRELNQGGRLLKWNNTTKTVDRIGTMADPLVVADVIGDWREEMITVQNGQLRINTPITTSSRRFYTLMHDPIYRIDVSSMTVGYRVPAHPSFFMGEGMNPPPVPSIVLTDGVDSSSDKGMILREWWAGLPGNTISDLTSSASYPEYPTGRQYLTKLEGPVNRADNYGARISGYLYPSTSGQYVFWIASDDSSQLWISSDALPAHTSLAASVPDQTNLRQWDKYPQQQSVPVSLIAGHKYFIEVLHKENTGSDHLSVAWQGPDFARTIIDGFALSGRLDFQLGDRNNDGNIDLSDMILFSGDWLVNDCGLSVITDLNGDCTMNLSDFEIFASQWLVTP
jgi:rhamnogalacturonan endolyase